jgi:glycosyltransferase involved in cell wall biosynthesis
MRILFVHDHRFIRGKGNVMYTGGSFPSATWERYLRHFDDVVVVGRDGGTARLKDNLARADAPNVRFELVEGQEGSRLFFSSRALDDVLERELAHADALLAMLPSQLALRAISKAVRRGIPFAAEVIGCAWDSYFNYGNLAGRAYAPIAFRRQQRALRLAPLALYVTREFLQRRYPCSGYTNYASNVEIEPMDKAGHAARSKRLAELAAGRRPRFGTVGSLRVRYKGYQIAIPALAKLRREGLDVHYSILGSGDPAPYRAIAERHGVADLVEFAGVRPPGRGVAEWLDDIDVHMQPSYQEGLPRATVEAMNRGAACMGSTTGGLPELLSPDRMHRPGDVDALARDIRLMATNPARIAETSQTDLQTVRDFFPDALQRRRDEVFSRLRRLADPSAGVAI